MLISIVIPCYRSSKTLPTVIGEIEEVFKNNKKYDYQVILVNDGSPDNTYEVICDLCAKNDKLIGINLSRNFGQARARMAALPYIQGDCAVYMDDDGQHPAEGIIPLVEKLSEGYDVVYAKFPQKKASPFKIATSAMYRKFMEMIGGKPKGIYTSSFLAWSRFAVDSLKKYHSPSPSTGSYLLKVTSKFANVEIPHRARIAGTSGYTLGKLFGLAIMGITNFTIIPLRASAVIGAFIAAIGFLYSCFLVLRKLIDPSSVIGYTSIMAAVLVLGGLILISLGIIGEYIGRIYMTLSDMPQYMVREVIEKKEQSALEKKDE